MVERGCGTTCTVTRSVRRRVFVDTNVIAHRFDGSEPQKQARAEGVLGLDEDFVVSTQVMLELHSVLTRKLSPKWSATEARVVLDNLAKLHVVTADARLVLRAAATSERHQLSVWDSMIVEAAVESGCSELWSEDLTTDSRIRGVLVVNPFA
ncbi:MAG: PIN domain-containing protein [Ornithinimicrobium sp.]